MKLLDDLSFLKGQRLIQERKKGMTGEWLGIEILEPWKIISHIVLAKTPLIRR